MNIYKYNHISFSFSLWLFGLSLVFHFRIFVGTLVFHLFEFDLSHLKIQAFEQVTENRLVMGDGLSISLIKVDPNLNAITEGVGNFGGDESEAIHLFTPLKCLSNEFKGETLINILFIGLTFRHLEDEPPSFLVLFIFPFGLDPLPEKLDRVNLFQRSINFISR